MTRVRFKGKSSPLVLQNGKTYEVLSVESGWYRIVDESGEDYLYPPDLFDVVVLVRRPPDVVDDDDSLVT